MPFSNLSEVTKTIVSRIEAKVRSDLGLANSVDVIVPRYPDGIKSNVLSLFLYHMTEDPHNRNIPPESNDNPPVLYTPAAYNLYYQLAANYTDNPSDSDIYDMQERMGIALKYLHDNPIMQENGNHLTITPKIVDDAASIQYWTAGSSQTNLSAYFIVSIVFLEPEAPITSSARVLTYGSAVYPTFSPRIEHTVSHISFIDPEGQSHNITVQPAQVTYDESFLIKGSGFTGSDFKLELIHPRWNEPANTDGWLEEPNDSTKMSATVNRNAHLVNDGSPVTVLPGIYSSKLIMSRQTNFGGGVTREVQFSSNQHPVIIVPCINQINRAGNTFTIDGEGFKGEGISTEDVQIVAGVNMLTITDDDPPEPGSFKIKTNTEILFQLPDDAPSGEHIPLRIIVAGAESLPKWILVP